MSTAAAVRRAAGDGLDRATATLGVAAPTSAGDELAAAVRRARGVRLTEDRLGDIARYRGLSLVIDGLRHELSAATAAWGLHRPEKDSKLRI